MTRTAALALWVRSDALVAASLARRVATAHGFGLRCAGELAIVACELASNAVEHGGGGTLTIDVHDAAMVIEVCDRGGSPVDAQALVSGALAHSHVDDSGRARSGLGRGIDAVRRLTDELTADRSGSAGLRVRARRARRASL